MADLQTLSLGATAVALAAAVAGAVEQRRLRRQLDEARHHVPTDEFTGLLDHRAFDQRVGGELKRASRFGGNVWLTVWTVLDGDADVFGRVAADGLRFPEVGFRLGERVFCFIRPNVTDTVRRDMYMRLRNSAPRTPTAFAEALYTGGATPPRALLRQAIDRLGGG